jgi:acetyltransferase-like isoleucine patch superfamily enzyme
MENKIYKNVKIGKDANIYPPCIIGFLPKKYKKKSTIIGNSCIIRPFTTIYAGVKIGKDFQCGHGVLIREGNAIGNNVSIGTGTVLEPENSIADNVRVHSHCFLECVELEEGVIVGPGVVFADDPHPPCPRYKECKRGAKVKKGAKIGAGVVILPGVVIGERALIGAGAVVVKDVPPNAVVTGEGARVGKYLKDLVCFKGFFKRPYEWEE